MSAVMTTPDATAVNRTIPPLSAERPADVGAALERLALSRERLRTAMLPTPKTPLGGGSGPTRLGNFTTGLVDRVKTMPGVEVFIHAVQDWWAKHPLHAAGLVAADASRKFARPIAERNPLGLLLGAVVVGALLTVIKPWRWLLKPALYAGLVPALASRALHELPVDSWLSMFASVAAPGRVRAAAARSAASAQPTSPVTTPAPAPAPARSPLETANSASPPL